MNAIYSQLHALAHKLSARARLYIDTLISRLVGPRYQDVLARADGQGTTEYAILVGVLVVIAILAIIAFKGKVQELWNAIRDGINQL